MAHLERRQCTSEIQVAACKPHSTPTRRPGCHPRVSGDYRADAQEGEDTVGRGEGRAADAGRGSGSGNGNGTGSTKRALGGHDTSRRGNGRRAIGLLLTMPMLSARTQAVPFHSHTRPPTHQRPVQSAPLSRRRQTRGREGPTVEPRAARPGREHWP